MVEVPGVAVAATVNVATLPPVALAAPKDAVTPLGRPEAVNTTAPLNPLWPLTAITLLAPDPTAMVKLAGVAESVKPGIAATVRETVALLLRGPEAPLRVSVVVPIAAALVALTFSVVVDRVVLALKDAVTPVGTPLIVRPTALLKPSFPTTEIVLVALLP